MTPRLLLIGLGCCQTFIFVLFLIKNKHTGKGTLKSQPREILVCVRVFIQQNVDYQCPKGGANRADNPNLLLQLQFCAVPKASSSIPTTLPCSSRPSLIYWAKWVINAYPKIELLLLIAVIAAPRWVRAGRKNRMDFSDSTGVSSTQRGIWMLFNQNSVTQELGDKEVQIKHSVSSKPATWMNRILFPLEKGWKPE